MSVVENRKDILFLVFLFLSIAFVAIFNYVVDPYFIFSDKSIDGFNNVKTHKYSNKRTIVFSDIKLNSKGKKVAFTGNCILSHYSSGLNDVAFFTIPIARLDEVANIIKNINVLSPEIKTIYWGFFYDDFWNTEENLNSDDLQEVDTSKFVLKDFINLFFSWNTTKYSIETVRDSIKNKGKDILYVYPYREIAKKTYEGDVSFDQLKNIQEIVDFAKEKGIEVIFYYSPIHVSKKVHIFTKDEWASHQELKNRLAEITPFYDYSLFNEYNQQSLDENSIYFIDNVHPTTMYNNMIVNDILSEKKPLAIQISKENVDSILKNENKLLYEYMSKNQDLVKKLKTVIPEDFNYSIKLK